MPEPENKRSPAELAESIEAADRPSKPDPGGLRFQWNVPRGVKPAVPFWFAALVIGLLVIIPLGNHLLR